MRSRSSSPTRHPLPALRSGFTLAEVVVALVLLALGAFALLAASGTAIRTVAGAETHTLAAAAARTRVEGLAAGGCSSLRAGGASDSVRGIADRWTVTLFRSGARIVADSVAYSDRGPPRYAIVRRLVVC